MSTTTRQFKDGDSVRILNHSFSHRAARIMNWHGEYDEENFYRVAIEGEPAHTAAGERIVSEHQLQAEAR